MTECKYRTPIKIDEEKRTPFITIVRRSRSVMTGSVVAKLKQQFPRGLCKLLTAHDIGPMECRQPNCSEKDCPDIAHLKK
jgi:hypothetical protein